MMDDAKRHQLYAEVRNLFNAHGLNALDRQVIISDLVIGHHVRIDLEHIRDEVRSIHDKNVSDIKKLEKARHEGRIPDK